MNVKEGSTELVQKKKREYNKFIFKVVNQLSLDEFKRYTNIRELMKNALLKRDETERQRLDYYIKQNFKQKIPKETLWQKGGFVSLKLKSYFYETEAAQRAFHNIFGTKKCSVNLETIHVGEPQKAELPLKIDIKDQEAEIGNVELENREAEIEKVDLTNDDSDVFIYPPKRMKLKYPNKKVVSIAKSSGIVKNVCEATFEEFGHTQQSTTADMLNHEIVISSSEGLAIISDTTAPKTLLRKESVHLSKQKIGPKSLQAPSSECFTKNVSSQPTIRQIQSPIHQGLSPIYEIKSSINQKQSPIHQGEPGITIPDDNTESTSRNDTQQTFNTPSQRQSAIAMPKEVTKQLSLNTPSENTSELRNKILQSFNAQISNIQSEFEKYVVRTPAFKQSLKHFWTEIQELYHCNLLNEENLLQVDVNCTTVEKVLKNQASIEMGESHPTNANASVAQNVNNSSTMTEMEVNHEKQLKSNVPNSSNVENSAVSPDCCIEIVDVSPRSPIVDESHNKNGSTAPSTSEGILPPGNEMLQNQSLNDVAEDQAANTNVSIVHTVENSATITDVEIKLEKMFDSYGSDVEVIDIPPEPPIEIMEVSTQELIKNLELDRRDSQDEANFVRPFEIPQHLSEKYTKSGSKATSISNVHQKTSSTKSAAKDDKDFAESPTSKSSNTKTSSSGSRNLWVSGLSSLTRATDLQIIFSKYGEVIGAKVIVNTSKPSTMCYGLVTMGSTSEASKCIEHLHRTELHGRTISVQRTKTDSDQKVDSSSDHKKPEKEATKGYFTK